jgi:RNA polymerase sigma-70 factor (ECF subfamily)
MTRLIVAAGTFCQPAGNTSRVDDDAGLLRRARQGDEAAFSRLFARHQRAVYLFAAKMCGPDAGDDVVQETFLAVLRQTGTFDPARGSVAAYLLGIARHLVLKRLGDRYRACVTDNVDDTTEWVTTQDDVLESLTRAETIDAVRAAVQSLPPVYREVVVLCELQEMDYADAADVIRCPIGTVRSRLHRARAMLMTKLAAAPAVGVSRE